MEYLRRLAWSLKRSLQRPGETNVQYDTILIDHGKAIAEHDERLAGHSKAITEHGELLADHSKALAGHERWLADHNKAFSDHSNALDFLSRRLDELERIQSLRVFMEWIEYAR